MKTLFRKFVEYKYGNKNINRISISIGILGNFKNHYMIYNNTGVAVIGTETLLQAIKYVRRHKNVYIASIIDKKLA